MINNNNTADQPVTAVVSLSRGSYKGSNDNVNVNRDDDDEEDPFRQVNEADVDDALEQQQRVHPTGDNERRNTDTTSTRQQRKWTVSAVTDYVHSKDFVELAICIVFYLLCLVIYVVDAATPRQRPIPVQYLPNSNEYVRNLANNEVHYGETVPDLWLNLSSQVFPVVVQALISAAVAARRRRTKGRDSAAGGGCGAGDIHGTICTYAVALGIVLFVTECVKLYVGYLRPNFYQACQPSADYSTCTGENEGGDSVRKSFPSGHAATSFCGLTLLTLFLHSRFGMPRYRQQVQQHFQQEQQQQQQDGPTTNQNHPPHLPHPGTYRLISLMSLAPVGLALFISASRIVDNKHFPADVVGGAVLGASVANYVHCLWLGY